MATVSLAAMGREPGASLSPETAVPLSTDPAEVKNLKVGSIVNIDTAAGLRECLITHGAASSVCATTTGISS